MVWLPESIPSELSPKSTNAPGLPVMVKDDENLQPSGWIGAETLMSRDPAAPKSAVSPAASGTPAGNQLVAVL